VLRRFGFALRPRWFPLHIFTIVVSVAMVLLGRWQLDVSESKHFSIQNFGYALQWWLFTAFGLFLWFRILRDAARRGGARRTAPTTAQAQAEAAAAEADETVTYRRYVMPTTPARSDDPVHSAYNDYLAGLAANDLAANDLAAREEEQR
jgi:DNA-binding transcriptional regulator of glucitol operon